MVCFVIAMHNEAEAVLDAMRISRRGDDVYEGTLYGESAAVVICGVGKVNAACGTQYAIDKFRPDAVINIGVAGGLNGEVEVGGVYGVSRAAQFDFDLSQLNGTPVGTLDGETQPYTPLCTAGNYPLKAVGTADRFNDDATDYLLLTRGLKADIRDMECAAVAQVCAKRGVKAYAFKIISDLAGNGSTTEQFKENLKLCFENERAQLENILAGVLENMAKR